MCIEDIQRVEDFDDLEKCFNDLILNGSFTLERVDLRDKKNRYDDLIFVIKRVDL